jgi:hypothetical protein
MRRGKIAPTSPGLDAPAANSPKHSFAKNRDLRTVDVPQAATILIAYQEARALLIGRSVALTNGKAGVTVTRVQIDQAERDAHMAGAMLEEVRAKLVLLKVDPLKKTFRKPVRDVMLPRRVSKRRRRDLAIARLMHRSAGSS